jgi:ribulose-5-phosphate 4-epimerase/fuculose-1-phosphate aldolase
MAEQYIGVKFKTVFLSSESKYEDSLPELIKWCNLFGEHGLAPYYSGGSFGNLSFRQEKGKSPFTITATGVDLNGILQGDAFVHVSECDFTNEIVYVYGQKNPSSESMLHAAIYNQRNDVMAVFHGHCDLILAYAKDLIIPVTEKECPYGSLELVKSVLTISAEQKFLVIKNHGFVSIGPSMSDTGQLALEILNKAKLMDSKEHLNY